MIELQLPHPISVNKAYSGLKVRFKSKFYKDWECKAYDSVEENCMPMKVDPTKKLKATYKLYTKCFYKNGNHKKIDVANYEKVTSDFLSQVIQGFEDSNIYEMYLEKINSDKNIIDIKIEELDDLITK